MRVGSCDPLHAERAPETLALVVFMLWAYTIDPKQTTKAVMSDRPSTSDIKLDLHNVVNAVKDVVTGWHDLGLNLRLPDSILRPIGSNHPQDAESCLRIMMSKWLSYDTQASWEKLANALTTMGENVIAANITSKFVTAATLPVAEISDDDKTCTLEALNSLP